MNAKGGLFKQGLKQNWKQFTLLVVINGFVGGMVGLERTILPELASVEFGIEASASVLSFILVFGISKALANYLVGSLSDKFGRRKLLIVGWLVALPIPFILINTNHWHWIVFSNVLLGINQGFAWSSAVVMKMDLAGPKQRGLAMGINESAGYLSVGVVAFITGWIAAEFGVRPFPFYLGIGFVLIGLILSLFFVRDTKNYVINESTTSSVPLLDKVFLSTSFSNRNLSSITQAGFTNNLNDGMMWGLLPFLLASRDFDLKEIAVVVSAYPLTWGAGQLVTGRLADFIKAKKLLIVGMLLQAVAIAGISISLNYVSLILLSVLLGLGTAVVYPTFLVAISQNVNPLQRAESIGVFRLWRDLGYAAGAVLSGVIADHFGFTNAVFTVAVITMISGVTVTLRMRP